MRHTFIQYALLVACLLLAACSSGKGEQDKVGGDTLVTVYNNPVIPISVPDPTVLRAGDGYFYLYGTEDIRNLPIYRSKDLVTWEQRGDGFYGCNPSQGCGGSLALGSGDKIRQRKIPVILFPCQVGTALGEHRWLCYGRPS